jgi:hypothetical protein
VHEKRIMSIYYDNISGIVYTCSEDKTLRTIERGRVTNSKKKIYIFSCTKILIK